MGASHSPTVRMEWRILSVVLPELLTAWCAWLPTVSGYGLGTIGRLLGLAGWVSTAVTAYSRATVC